MNYLDFDIEIREQADSHYAIAVRSLVGEARSTSPFPLTAAALEADLLRVENAILRSVGGRRKNPNPDEATVQAFGQKLFEFLLSSEPLSLYRQCQQLADAQGKGVRVKLNILPPGLAVLPWEFLYDPRRRDYVCLDPNTPLIRYTELPLTVPRLPVTPPLRILGVCINAVDLGDLDVAEEQRRIENAVRGLQAQGQVELTWLEGQTSDDLQRAMRSGPWHILHFIGHGSFDALRNEGSITLADEQGKAAPLYATQLARLLQWQRSSLRLVVLNACEGSRGGQQDLFTSTATMLVRSGIPAVLAMQYEITDDAAIQFARSFYAALADNLSIDTAVVDARIAITLHNSHSLEWGTPVLYMRSQDGHLFDFENKDSKEEQTQTHLRRIDAALPKAATFDSIVDLLVKVTLPESPSITVEDFPSEQKPQSITIDKAAIDEVFPVDRASGKIGKGSLEIYVVTDDFDIIGPAKQRLLVLPNKDSRLIKFLLRTKHLGICRVNVNVYDEFSQYLGSTALFATVEEQTSAEFVPKVASITLKLFVQPQNLKASVGKSSESIDAQTSISVLIDELDLWQLQKILATLYPNEGSIHRLFNDAKISFNERSHAYINSYSRSDNSWTDFYRYDLLYRARKTGRLGALLAVILAEYGGTPALQALLADYYSTVAETAVTSEGQNAIRYPRARMDFDWVTIPAGEFLMGSDKQKDPIADEDEFPQHSLYLPTYRIARVPVTNAQYKQFVDATEHRSPRHWQDGQIPRGEENHPVVYVSWADAVAFCQWAGGRLPTEAEWEKAARGADGRLWPWGNEPPDQVRCNFDGKVGATTPVGAYAKGASPYGVYDMAGNVWEWTSSLYKAYPYNPDDGREDPTAVGYRVLRGGSFDFDRYVVRCAYRIFLDPVNRDYLIGFRVMSPGS